MVELKLGFKFTPLQYSIFLVWGIGFMWYFYHSKLVFPQAAFVTFTSILGMIFGP